MAGLKTFLPTEGTGVAGKLFDEAGREILITSTAAREAIAGGVVPVDIGTRPNANDGDPLRTSFSKINNFVLASYQNDSDIQERVGSLEAGSVFLGMYRQDTIPRREVPFATPLPWTAGEVWPVGVAGAVEYFQRDPEALPDLNARLDATPVYAMLSEAITGRPNLSVVIDNISDTSVEGDLTITLIFPSAIDSGLALPPGVLVTPIEAVGTGGTTFAFNTISANITLGQSTPTVNTITAAGIAEEIRRRLDLAQGGVDYFTFNIEAPTADTRRLTVDYNFKAAIDTPTETTLIPTVLFAFTGAGVIETYGNSLDIISSGNTGRVGLQALPWFDQNIANTIIPAYTMLIWTINGWAVAADGFGAIDSKFLFFDDERANKEIPLTLTGAGDTTTILNTLSVRELQADDADFSTRDAITEVQQFGINYLHSATIDAGEY